MSRAIPTVRSWRVRVLPPRAEGNHTITTHQVHAPTTLLAQLAFKQDYPQYWGHRKIFAPMPACKCGSTIHEVSCPAWTVETGYRRGGAS